MPKNVMKLIKPSPHRGRNDFDLSHRTILDMNFGALHVPSCIETVPDDDYKISIADLLRTNSMVTSPFLRAKQHIDVWWVPYHDLWHNFEQFMVQREQPVSSALKGSTFLPHTSLYYLWSAAQNNAFTGSLQTDIVGLNFNKGATSLLQELGYGYDQIGSYTSQVKVNLFRLAAYNYIWYNEYRQQYYDDGKRGLGSFSAAALFNFDDLACTSQATAELDWNTNAARLNAMVQRRYRTWKKDLFTGLLPATQFGSVSTFGNSLQEGYLFSKASSPSAGQNVELDSYNMVSVAGAGANNNHYNFDSLGIDVLSLRRSEAIQIWRENALRAGNRVWDNYQAHYGVESYFRDHRPTHIASIDAPLNVSDVMTTATSDYSGNTNPNTQVGDIAGKGIMSLDRDNIRFHSSDFGVIMCIASILPEAEYNQEGVDRCNQLLESEDFFIPEYENLGLEAVSSQCFKNTGLAAQQVVGYAPRYFAYKTKLDRCLGTFVTGGLNAPWCSPKYDVSNVFNTPPAAMPLSVLYVNPAIFDVNFSVAVSVLPQIKADFYFDVDAVRPMSVTGLPFS